MQDIDSMTVVLMAAGHVWSRDTLVSNDSVCRARTSFIPPRSPHPSGKARSSLTHSECCSMHLSLRANSPSCLGAVESDFPAYVGTTRRGRGLSLRPCGSGNGIFFPDVHRDRTSRQGSVANRVARPSRKMGRNRHCNAGAMPLKCGPSMTFPDSSIGRASPDVHRD